MMNQILTWEHGCLTKHPLKTGCLKIQECNVLSGGSRVSGKSPVFGQLASPKTSKKAYDFPNCWILVTYPKRYTHATYNWGNSGVTKYYQPKQDTNSQGEEAPQNYYIQIGIKFDSH